ncbi:MAG: helix-turn-helix domain-containing protein [Halolamina sp.]
MHLATFRISGSNIYESVTGDAGVAVECWCNDHCDLLHVEGPDAVDALDPVRSAVGIRESLGDGDEVVAITEDCLRDHEAGLAEDYVRANGCLLLPPLRYEHGDRVVRVLALEPAALSRCFQDMVADGLSVSVDAKRTVDTVPEGTPMLTTFPDLTRRQKAVLTAAIDGGYYELPREVTTTELAEDLGLARRTVEEHLRRAEKKVVTGMAAFL